MGITDILGNIIGYVADHPTILAVGILLYVFIFALSVFLSGPKPGPNPFAKDKSQPPKPIEIDQKVRDQVIKQGFTSKKIPEQLDAIVVGSGIGGLTTACILAKAGKKVLVLEQHDQAGGCCHTFIDKGFEFDVGIHYIGEMNKKMGVSKILMDQLTNGQVQWVDLDDEYDIVALGPTGKQKFYSHMTGVQQWRAKMLEKFPKEQRAIDKYLEILREVRKSSLGLVALKVKSKWFTRLLVLSGFLKLFTNYFKYASKSTEQVLSQITDNADLKAVLTYNFGDYGVPPGKSSFVLHAFLINHFLGGSSYPLGGASEFAYHMIPIIEEAGGRVLVRAPVKEILCNNGRAVGVRVMKGGQQVDIYAPKIISDAGVINTFKSLLPQEVAQKTALYRYIRNKKVTSGLGAISMFVGLKGTKEELKLKAQNMWALEGNDLTRIVDEYMKKDLEDALAGDIPLLFISFPSAKDPTSAKKFPGKSTCTVVTFARWDWFEAWEDQPVMKRGPDYESIKKTFQTRIWEQVLQLFPQLRDKDEFMELGTPVTNKYYLGSPRGEIYGLDHDIERLCNPDIMMHLRPDCEIPGLFLTGQDVFTCGFSGAMFGGVLSASICLNRNLYDDILDLRKVIIQNEKNKESKDKKQN